MKNMKLLLLLAGAVPILGSWDWYTAIGPAGPDLLPFHAVGQDRSRCFQGAVGLPAEVMERKCGTSRFCDAHSDMDRVQRYLGDNLPFNDVVECYQGHVDGYLAIEAARPPPRRGFPFLPKGRMLNPDADCLYWARVRSFHSVERSCGTDAYCEAMDDREGLRKYYAERQPQFDSAEACFAAHRLPRDHPRAAARG